MNKQFSKEDQGRVCLSHLAGGEIVAMTARAFTHKTCVKEKCKIGKWYKQRWIDKSHSSILKNYKLRKRTTDWSINAFKDCRKFLGLPGPGKEQPDQEKLPMQGAKPAPGKSVNVQVVTEVLPERMKWVIEGRCRLKAGNYEDWRPMCKGGPYQDWYSKIKTKCWLTKGCHYRAICTDNVLPDKGQGWSRGYLRIGKLKICDEYTYRMKERYVETFVL